MSVKCDLLAPDSSPHTLPTRKLSFEQPWDDELRLRSYEIVVLQSWDSAFLRLFACADALCDDLEMRKLPRFMFLTVA